MRGYVNTWKLKGVFPSSSQGFLKGMSKPAVHDFKVDGVDQVGALTLFNPV